MTKCMLSLEKTVAVFAEVSQGRGDADHTGHAASGLVTINYHGCPSAPEQVLRKLVEPAGGGFSPTDSCSIRLQVSICEKCCAHGIGAVPGSSGGSSPASNGTGGREGSMKSK